MKCAYSQLHTQRFLWWKQWAHSIHWAWAPEPVWTSCEREKSILCQALNPGRLARSQGTDWAILRNQESITTISVLEADQNEH
jgi:hypothetical protein